MIRTGYSFKTAVGELSDVVSRIQEVRLTAAPICDRLSTFGFVRWTKACKAVGLRPVYGVEIAVVPELGAKKPIVDYWRFLAIKDLAPLHELVALATSNPGKEPSLLYKEALAAKGVIKITGKSTLLSNIPKRVYKDLYIGLSPSLPLGLYTEAKKRKMQFCAVSDNVFPREADLEFYRVAIGWRSNTQMYPQHILSDEEWRAASVGDKKEHAAAIKNRDAILARSVATLKQATLLTPKKELSLLVMCIEGAKRTGTNLDDPVYAERLKRELNLIQEKGFEDYFYIIADMVQFAKKIMVVGPARGSSCGSLVCYLLDITTVDPIPYGLIFERFIDTTRADLPDIDIDFSDARRVKVFEYAEQKYGAKHVARLGTVGMFKPLSALNQAGDALDIPPWDIQKVQEVLIDREDGDERALKVIEDTLNETGQGKYLKEKYPEVVIAQRMEGHPSHASQHAAGIVITQKPVTEYVAVDSRTSSAMCDKKDAEALGLLKIDALGLIQLSIFERTLELIGKPDKSGYLETLPLNDKKAFDVLNRGHFSGIFQFTGNALKGLTRQVNIESLEDMISITSLARPGPLASGGAASWVRRKNGGAVTYPHPVFEPILRNTLGIVIYQEQVMQVGRDVGDLSWEDVTALRKAMSRSLGKEHFNKYGERWKEAARKKGVPSTVLDQAWDELCAHGSYGFNRSHAVAYSLVSYWCCWLKAHHPLEFAAATLDAQTEPLKQIEILRELQAEGIDYVPVDPDRSVDRWIPAEKDGKRILVGPLTAIKGIGPVTMREVIDSRTSGAPLREGIRKKLDAAKTEIDSLNPIADAIRRAVPDLSRILAGPPTPVKEVQCRIGVPVRILAVASRITQRDENEPEKIARRKGRVFDGQTACLNLFMRDDTDEIFCKIDRFDFERLGLDVLNKGRPGKSIYAVYGTVPDFFRMIAIQKIMYLGEIDGSTPASLPALQSTDPAA